MKKEPTGKAKGAIARAEALSPERRQEIAKKAAIARWGEKPVRATHRGNFKEEFGFDVDCYVLDDEQKTAVISKRGINLALGSATTSAGWIQRFIDGDKIAPFVGLELREKIENPVIFQWSSVVSKMPLTTIHGYDATILIDICKSIIKADDEGKLLARQKPIVKQAHIIINASAKAGIKNLVYALAGYESKREEVIAAFKLFVREEAREYEKEFPNQLYTEWYRLYQLPKPERNKPWKFKQLTLNHVYTPLARSNGKILELARALKAKRQSRREGGGRRWANIQPTTELANFESSSGWTKEFWVNMGF